MDVNVSTHGIEEPNKDAGAFTGRLKEAPLDANSSIYGMEKPSVDAYDSTYGSKEPNVNVDNSTSSTKAPTMDVGAFSSAKELNMNVGAPTNSVKEPNVHAGASTSANEPNMDVGPPTNRTKEPNMDVDSPANSMKAPNTDAGPSSSMKEPTYGIEKPNKTTYDSAHCSKDSNMDKYSSNYSYENPYADKYDSNYSYENPYADDYDDNYGYDDPYADDYDGNYGYEDPYAEQYDANYSYENPYADDYDSTYGNEDPYAYDSTYGNEDPYADAPDSAYKKDPNPGAYDSSYGNKDPKMNMDADASGTVEPRTFKSLQCPMCCYFAPSKQLLLQHYKSALHKYIDGLDHKRRSLINSVQTLDEAIEACGESEPLIGLEYIYQYAPNKKGLVLHGCKLCQSVYRLDLMYLHIVSPKHRIMYLSKLHPEMGIDNDFKLNTPNDYDRLHDHVQTVEHNFGRKRIHHLDTCYSQKPIGEMDDPSVTKKKSRWDSMQDCPQPTDKWNDGNNYNKKSMDRGGDGLSQRYDEGGPPSSDGHPSRRYGNGEGRGGPGNVNQSSRRNRFSSPTNEPVPQDYNSSDFPGNRNVQSATQKGRNQFNYQNRQDLESGHGNADNKPSRPNQDNRNVPNKMRNQANDFPNDRRAASRFDDRQGSGKQDRFSNSNDQQRNRDQFSRSEGREQNNTPRDGRFRPGDRDDSRFDRRARSPDNFRRGSENQGGCDGADDRRRFNDRLSRNDRGDQNVSSRGRQNRQGGSNKHNKRVEFHDYEEDYYGGAADRSQNNDRGRDLPGNQISDEVGNRHGDQKGSTPEPEPEETDPDRIFIFSTFGKSASFRELKTAYKAGHIMNKDGQEKQEQDDKDEAMDKDSDMDCQSMDLSDDDEGSFLFNQEMFEFLNNYIIKSEKDEHFALEARELLSMGLRTFDMQEKERMEEGLESEMPIKDSASDTYNKFLSAIKDYFSLNDTDERDEMDSHDDDDDDDDDEDVNNLLSQLVASQGYFSSRSREVNLPQPARANGRRTRFSS